MKFCGQIIFLVKDDDDQIHYYKKKSKAPAELEQYLEYIQLLEKELDQKLIKSYVYNLEDKKYIWGSSVWRKDLDKKISPNHQKYLTYLAESRKDVKFIGPYKSMSTKSLHLCCRGHEWLIQPKKVKNGETCPKCDMKVRESNGVKYITELLVVNSIVFIKEVSLSSFGHERDLRLDFVICQNNYPLFAIEFNGIQHYVPLKSDFFGGHAGARKRKERDRIKRAYCLEIGLPVIDIHYRKTEGEIKKTVLYYLNLFELIH